MGVCITLWPHQSIIYSCKSEALRPLKNTSWHAVEQKYRISYTKTTINLRHTKTYLFVCICLISLYNFLMVISHPVQIVDTKTFLRHNFNWHWNVIILHDFKILLYNIPSPEKRNNGVCLHVKMFQMACDLYIHVLVN